MVFLTETLFMIRDAILLNVMPPSNILSPHPSNERATIVTNVEMFSNLKPEVSLSHRIVVMVSLPVNVMLSILPMTIGIGLFRE